MRGDSLRDLYAKTLAILGLGILAAIGALVDYWPTATDIPAVASTIVQSPPADPVPAIDIAAVSTATTVTVIAPAVRRQRSSVSLAAVRVAPAEPTQVAPVVVATETLMLSAMRSIALSAPPPVAPVAPVVPVAAVDVPASEVTLPSAPPVQTEAAPITLGVGSRPVAEADGFFGNATSAVKKTGESIVNTTVKTGTSIIKAFGFVGSAVKKVI